MKPTKPHRLAVVIPSFNRKAFIFEALDSILTQNCSPELQFHVIVVDDGSTDGTFEAICEKYTFVTTEVANVATLTPQLTLMRQPNRERGAARNTGAKWAIQSWNAEWLLFFDSDDRMAENALNSFEDSLCENFSAIYGLIQVWDSSTTPNPGKPERRRRRSMPDGDLSYRALSRTILPLGATLIAAKCFEQVGPFSEDRRMSGSEDWAFLTKVAFAGKVHFVPHLIAYYRQHGGNTNNERYLTSLDLAVRSLEPAMKRRFPESSERVIRCLRTRASLLKTGALLRMGRLRDAKRLLVRTFLEDRLWWDYRPYRMGLSLLKHWVLRSP